MSEWLKSLPVCQLVHGPAPFCSQNCRSQSEAMGMLEEKARCWRIACFYVSAILVGAEFM
eukprot:2229264-Amphidinium_carterae.1